MQETAVFCEKIQYIARNRCLAITKHSLRSIHPSIDSATLSTALRSSSGLTGLSR